MVFVLFFSLPLSNLDKSYRKLLDLLTLQYDLHDFENCIQKYILFRVIFTTYCHISSKKYLSTTFLLLFSKLYYGCATFEQNSGIFLFWQLWR